MKQIILLITFLFNSLFINAQVNMDKLFLDSMLNTSSGKFLKTSDNGVAFCGSQIANQIGGLPQTGHIIKLDDAYNFQWAKSYSKGISSSTFFTLSDSPLSKVPIGHVHIRSLSSSSLSKHYLSFFLSLPLLYTLSLLTPLSLSLTISSVSLSLFL